MKNILALEASAGSGKTFALSVRYIALLFLGANPSSIVALTFTKKAANEMKERIYETLVNLSTKESELKELCRLLKKDKEEILKQRQKVVERFLEATLHIETIDAFFGKILRKFSLYLGFMPDFQTASSSNQAKLEYEFVKAIKKEPKTFHSLIQFLLNEERKFHNLFELFELLYEKDDNLNTKEFPKVTFPSPKNLFQITQEIYEYLQKKEASKRALGMFDVADFEGLMKKTFWGRESLNYSTFKKCFDEELDELFWALKDEFKSYCIKKEEYLLGELYALFNAYKTIKTTLAKNSNELTFSDVTKLTHTLLRGKVESEFLYFRLDSHIKHLLIDEFQDTNIVQFDILRPIVKEIVSGIGTSEKSFFYVGDTKQSIYRFRGGSKGLFSLVANEFGIPKEVLETNYRSDGVVVDFVNETFSPFLKNYTNQKVLEEKKKSGFVKVLECEEVKEGIVEALSSLLDSGVSQDDIAVLCYTNSDVSAIKEAILEWNKALHVSSQSTKSIFQTHEVQLMVEYLKYLYFGYELSEKNALVLLGKSFTCKLEKLKPDWLSPLETNIIQIVEFLKLDGSNEDVLKFIELSSTYSDVESFLFDLKRLDIPSTTQETKGIRILTIHKSKGLEFPFVIVADKIGRDTNRSQTLLYEYEDERLKRIFLRMKNREFVDEAYEKAREKENKLNQEDRLNAQYVAFTRGKNGLMAIMKSQKSTFLPLALKPIQKGKITPPHKEPKKDKKQAVRLKPISSFGAQEVKHTKEDEISYSLKSIYFGRALHYLLEIMGSFSKESLEVSFWGMKNRYGTFLTSSELEDIKRRVFMLIEDEIFLNLVSRGKILKEQPLVFEGQKKQLDLLIEYDDKFVIIDYKSSSQVHEENLKQIEFYKKAVKAIGGKKVEAWLFYLKKEKIDSKSL